MNIIVCLSEHLTAVEDQNALPLDDDDDIAAADDDDKDNKNNYSNDNNKLINIGIFQYFKIMIINQNEV